MKKTFSFIVLLLSAALTIGCTALASCTSSDKQTREQQDIATIADIPADGNAAPLQNEPFTHGKIGVLMQQGQEDLLQMVNSIIRQMKADGSLRRLHEKYDLQYE